MAKNLFKNYKSLSDKQSSVLIQNFSFISSDLTIIDEEQNLIMPFIAGDASNPDTLSLSDDSWKVYKKARIHIKLAAEGKYLRQFLFETDNCIGSPFSTFGIGLSWRMSESMIKGATSTNSIELTAEMSDERKFFDFFLDFNVGELTGKLICDFFVFFKSSTKNIKGICSLPGAKLGIVAQQLVLCFDESSKLFPIINVSLGKNEPLWTVEVPQILDPLTDTFSEDYLYISLNTDHPDFKKLKQCNSYTPLMYEVMANALEFMINQLCRDPAFVDIIRGDEYALPTSIADVVRNMIRNCRLDISDPISIHHSIRNIIFKYVRQNVGKNNDLETVNKISSY